RARERKHVHVEVPLPRFHTHFRIANPTQGVEGTRIQYETVDTPELLPSGVKRSLLSCTVLHTSRDGTALPGCAGDDDDGLGHTEDKIQVLDVGQRDDDNVVLDNWVIARVLY
ncbi:hypothetical protein ID866_5369, partial [Astraeus odoratus]